MYFLHVLGVLEKGKKKTNPNTFCLAEFEFALRFFLQYKEQTLHAMFKCETD